MKLFYVTLILRKWIMEKKNIIIVILSILVVGLSGYIVYDKVFSDNDNAEDNQLIKTENAEFQITSNNLLQHIS